jgi:hypothetical protein
LVGWLGLRPAFRPEPEGWREFVPWCGSNRNPIAIEGELRERFLWLMSEVFVRWNVEHVISDGRILTKGEGSFNGASTSLLDVENNAQWKVVSAIAAGVTIDDVYFPPPPMLLKAISATEAHYGPFPRRDEKGQRIFGPDPRFESCALMRAAILKHP